MPLVYNKKNSTSLVGIALTPVAGQSSEGQIVIHSFDQSDLKRVVGAWDHGVVCTALAPLKQPSRDAAQTLVTMSTPSLWSTNAPPKIKEIRVKESIPEINALYTQVGHDACKPKIEPQKQDLGRLALVGQRLQMLVARVSHKAAL